MSEQIYLSRRNLLTLLSKLDRAANGEVTACTIVKYQNQTDPFVQTMDAIAVTAIEDSDYYEKRAAGEMHPRDEVVIEAKTPQKHMRTAPCAHIYTGYEKGLDMRFTFALDEFDGMTGEMVTVKFPENTYSVSSSFMRGLFEGSMKSAKTESEFLSRYRVEGPKIVVENFMSIVYRYFILHK